MVYMKNSPNFREMDAQYYMPAFTRDMMITTGIRVKSMGLGRKGVYRLRGRDCRVQHGTLPPGRGEGNLRPGT